MKVYIEEAEAQVEDLCKTKITLNIHHHNLGVLSILENYTLLILRHLFQPSGLTRSQINC